MTWPWARRPAAPPPTCVECGVRPPLADAAVCSPCVMRLTWKSAAAWTLARKQALVERALLAGGLEPGGGRVP